MSAYQRRRVIAVWGISIMMAIALAIALIDTKVAIGPTTSWSGVVTPGPEAPATFLALVPIVVALLWTGLAWFRGAFDDKTTATPSTKNIESAPTPYKMALLLEMMDDDEREAFKQQLKRDILASETGHGDFDRLALEETEKRKRN
jgi:hypothetical protein